MSLKKLGRYDLIRVLGKGAMGLVYEARDPNLDRRVAIKTIKVESLSEEAAAEYEVRFRTEARSAARLQHPNIVSVYDSDRDIDIAYLVMEFIQGEDLKHHLDKGKLYTLEESLRIMGDLLSALEYAHKQHIVHRDIKPANLLIEASGRVKLTDFGVARIQDSGDATRTKGSIVGTLKYMSPEQLQGLPIDARSDLFAAGVVLYQLLTGTRPFDGDSDFAIIQKIVSHQPAAATVHNTLLPPAMDAVVARALAKDRDMRFASAQEFAEALLAASRFVADATMTPTVRRDALGPGATWSATLKAGESMVDTHSGSNTSSSLVTQEVELVYWKDVKDSADASDIAAFVAKFPNGIYVDLAKRRLRQLGVKSGGQADYLAGPGSAMAGLSNFSSGASSNPSNPSSPASAVAPATADEMTRLASTALAETTTPQAFPQAYEPTLMVPGAPTLDAAAQPPQASAQASAQATPEAVPEAKAALALPVSLPAFEPIARLEPTPVLQFPAMQPPAQAQPPAPSKPVLHDPATGAQDFQETRADDSYQAEGGQIAPSPLMVSSMDKATPSQAESAKSKASSALDGASGAGPRSKLVKETAKETAKEVAKDSAKAAKSLKTAQAAEAEEAAQRAAKARSKSKKSIWPAAAIALVALIAVGIGVKRMGAGSGAPADIAAASMAASSPVSPASSASSAAEPSTAVGSSAGVDLPGTPTASVAAASSAQSLPQPESFTTSTSSATAGSAALSASASVSGLGTTALAALSPASAAKLQAAALARKTALEKDRLAKLAAASAAKAPITASATPEPTPAPAPAPEPAVVSRTPTVAASGGPRAACEDQVLFAFQSCMNQQCGRPVYANHPVCVARRAMEQKRLEIEQR